MKKKILSKLLVFTMAAALLNGCGKTEVTQDTQAESEAPAASEADTQNQKTAAVCLPIGSDEFFVLIGDALKQTLEEQGYSVQIADANSDGQQMIKQVQNFTAAKTDFMYIFPAGDAAAFEDVIKEATDSGIKTLVTNNDLKENVATTVTKADEFYMGAMMAPLVSKWIDDTFPNAGEKEIKVLTLEQSMIPDMVKRSAGMKLVGEKFLRKVDMTTGLFVKTEGEKVTYLDADGAEKEVEENTGGLLLDENGRAMLNPYYDERVNIVTISNRTIQTNLDAQNAMDTFIATEGAKEVKAILCYGGDGAAGASEKLLSFVEQGIITEELSNLAVFGADMTESNVNRIKQSANNESLVRGVITNGNIIETLKNITVKMVSGEEVEAENWEPIGYAQLNDARDDAEQLLYEENLPESTTFFN